MTRRWIECGMAPLALAALVGLAGCLPGSGRRNDRSLPAADSASVQFAATVPMDTLELAWTTQAPEEDSMPVPTSLGWMSDGQIAVVETQIGSLRLFSADGTYQGRIDLPDDSYPYFAGTSGDTVAVIARGPGSILWAVPDAGVIAERAVGEDALNAWAPSPSASAWVRVGGGPTGEPAALRLLEADGTVVQTVALPTPWRASGFLRVWGDSVLALSGYRPIVDVITGGSADTLALEGFDSPQLARSARFLRGDIDEPPLLTSSADALGEYLYVLNLRADHVRVDVYDRGGTLQRVLVSPAPWQPIQHVALDIAARRQPEGGVELAVLMQRPRGLLQSENAYVALYRWRPDPTPPL